MTIDIPHALKAEHDELHAELARATRAGGRTGAEAREVARIMHPHFLDEEAFALPPLGLLAELSAGKVDERAAEALGMTEKLGAELPRMLAEHEAIVAALQRLADAAKAEGKPEYAQFAEKLIAHARFEEEVSYPAALLVGRYLKSVTGARS